MASWQFDLYLVPKERLVTLLGAYPITISRELLDETTWSHQSVTEELLETDLACFVRKSKSWDPEVAIWGEDDGNRIDVVYENKTVVEVFLRIDVRQLDRSFLESVIRLAKKYECVFITTNMRVLEPTFSNVIKAIQESDAYRFVDDPNTYLDLLNSE